jgi:serine/threonine-protein kinase
MPLTAGAHLGPYEILAAIGAGGMGEVYRARDTKLNRDVALKVLPDAFTLDADRLARFKREAQVLASLNHPNIGAIYGFEETNPSASSGQAGLQALVLELVEGPTLADRIAQGPLPLDEALPIAKQLADALEAAHEQGIIHRDLKPANIKLRADGTVKVLDFGLAKALAPDSAGAAAGSHTRSPTITTPAMTLAGVILGTAAYMAPEQAKGREADKRSDIWAFGCVVYEMLTGQRAFDGEDMTDVLGGVVRLEPKWEAFPANLSPALRTLIQRCLAKDRQQRVSDISAVKFVLTELQNLVASHLPAAPVAAPRPRWRRAVPAVVIAMLAALLGGAVAWTLRPSPTPSVVAQFSVPLPDGQSFNYSGRQIVAVSADGTRLAYIANFRIYIRSINEPEPHAVPRTDAESNTVTLPLFAPDGQSIAFYESSALKRIPLTGGVATTIANISSPPCGASWGPDGLVFANSQGGRNGIWRVSPTGGVPELLVEFPNDETPCSPHLLPGGRTVLFTLNKVSLGAGTETGEWDKAQVVAQSLADGTRHVLMEGSDARYLPTGHLLYSIAGTMHAVTFDADRIALTGGPVPVIQGVTRSRGEETSATQAAVSESGTLVYLPGPATTAATPFSLLVGDGRSDPVRLDVPAGALEHPRVSPDGTMLAVGRNDRGRSDIWIYDLSGRTAPRQLTTGGENRYPIWSSDGRRVTFQSGREGDEAIFSQAVDGNAAVRVTTPAKGEMHVPEAWSRDGYLLYSAGKGLTLRTSLQALRVDDGTTVRFTRLPGLLIRGAAFSPDGRWVAYSSEGAIGGATRSATGRDSASVFVEPFPPTGQRIPAPKDGTLRDFHPVWARDGQRLLYSRFPQRLMAVPFSTQPPAFGLPVELARTPPTGITVRDARGYDVLPDGRVVSISPLIGSSPAMPRGEIRVVLNWLEELKRLVPTK